MKKLLLLFAILLIGMIGNVSAEVLIENNWNGTIGALDMGNLIDHSSLTRGQSFTVGTTGNNENYIINKISMPLQTLAPINLTLILKATNSTGFPVGDNLSIGYYNFTGTENGWVNVTMANYTLQASTQYIFYWIGNPGLPQLGIPLTTYFNGTNMYSGGRVMRSNNNGTVWLENGAGNDDIAFRIYGENLTQSQITVQLNSPTNGTVLNAIGTNFNASYLVTSLNMSNATYNIWYTNGSLFNQTTVPVTGNYSNNSNIFIDTFVLGNYLWNVNLCGINSTGSLYCGYALNNLSYSVGATILNQTYNNITYETKREIFDIAINLFNDSQLSLAQFVYNSQIYTVSNITYTSNVTYLEKSIDIPVNSGSGNSTNSFYWKFIYTGGTQQTQTLPINYQTAQPLNFSLCSSSPQYINFTIKDEVNDNILPGTFQGTFNYWIGGGDIKKNYSLNDLSGGNSTFTFCFIPKDLNVSTNAIITYQPTGYSINDYNLLNATLTNITNPITLYSLATNASTKFYVTIKQDTSFLSGVLVNIQKYFVGSGVYKTVAIKTTDNSGQFPMYMDLDKNYRFIIIQNGNTIDSVDKSASCSSAPCSIQIDVASASGNNLYSGYYDIYAGNVISNLSYNPTTKIVTYTFLDPTGLAHYFRLIVTKGVINGSIGSNHCDSYSYTSAGTITCNMTGQNGDWFAKTYLSRSPEKLDKIISFVLSDAATDLGFFGLFISFAIIVTVVVGAAVLSKGSPSTVVFMLGLSILGLKLMTIFPYSWIVVTSIEALIIFILIKIKT